jgi:hypothetical protein
MLLLLKLLLNARLLTLERLKEELLHKHAFKLFSSLFDVDFHSICINVVTVENKSLHARRNEIVLAELHSEEINW